MAESILSDIAVELISKLASFGFDEIGVCWGLRDELDKLKRTVGTIEAVLLHAQEQSLHNPQVKHWLGLLSEALYDADDLLDEFSTEALRQQVMGGSDFLKKVRLFFSSSNQFAFGLKMGHKVKALRERLDEIAAEKNKFHLEERSSLGRPSFVHTGRDQTHSTPPQVVIGREHDKEEIVRLLVSSHCDENVSVVSIVGIGGLGKTTLAQMVYNDDSVKAHFELTMWVCVSDEFDVKLLVKKLLESITRKTPDVNEMDPLKDLLHEKINGRSYLLVLDDVWNEDLQKWYSLKDLLGCGGKGSKIVVTTRLRTVAEMSRPIFIHELRGLPDNEAWSLFKQMAFKQQQPPNPSREVLGKEIVAKCCGVPLAIKTIGGMLCVKDSESAWLVFKEKELSAIDVYKNGILPILKLSYDHLPSHYKQCFAYCSLFPKDFRICVEELIQLWKAQGYLKSQNPDECLRDLGFEYFMDLFRLSFFQDVEMDDFGSIEYCKIHDLMHDLSISVAGETFYAPHFGTVHIQNKTRHMSFEIYHNSLSEKISSLMRAKKIRTVLAFNQLSTWFQDSVDAIKEEEVDVLLYNSRCLRVLNLSRVRIMKLSNSICKLKHLRYLDLSGNRCIKKLPNSISDLQNLQVLKLQKCDKLAQLPSNITKLVNLTDLDNKRCYGLCYIPQGIGKIAKLEKLSQFVIAIDHSISKHSGGLDELHSLNNLRGELGIMNLRYVKNALYEYKAAHLSAKEQLHKLTLHWGFYEENNNCGPNDVAIEETGLEALCPHPNLKALTVWYYRGVTPPCWLPSLTNLVSVRFENCTNIRWLPPMDQLSHLKTLIILHSTNLEHIDVKYEGNLGFFPSLTDLTFEDCPNLKGFEKLSSSSSSSTTEELPCFPCLSTLQISGCPNLNYLPLFPKLKSYNSDGDGMNSLMKILKKSSNSASFTLSQLHCLEISDMEDSLENELLPYLPCLQNLKFFYCSFRTVCSDVNDDEKQWQSLKVLRYVKFLEMPNLVALPKGLQHVTSLHRLHIYDCPSLECIPEWMTKLIALQDLTIRFCPRLMERCNNKKAEDWPNISHIPNISIDHKQIQRNGCYLL